MRFDEAGERGRKGEDGGMQRSARKEGWGGMRRSASTKNEGRSKGMNEERNE